MLKPSYHDTKALDHFSETGIEESVFYRELSARLSRIDKDKLDDMLKHAFIVGYNAGESDGRKEVFDDLKQF